MATGQAVQVITIDCDLQVLRCNFVFFYLDIFISGGTPVWGSVVLLVQSLEMQCYTVMYYDEGDNKSKATDFINMVLDLCEDKMGTNEKLNFGDWKPSMLSI